MSNEMFIIAHGGPIEGSMDVTIDGNTQTFNDFVAVGYDELTEKTTLLQNADTVTLGKAYKMLAVAFHKSYNALDEETKAIVDSVLKEDVA